MGVYQISSLFIYLLAPDISGFFRELLDGFDFYVCWINITFFSDLFLEICSFDPFYCNWAAHQSTNVFTKKTGIPKNPPNFSKFLFNRKKFVCLFVSLVSTFSGFGNFFQSFENLSRKSILSNKTISYLSTRFTANLYFKSKSLENLVKSRSGLECWVLFIMTTPWFDKNVICIAF